MPRRSPTRVLIPLFAAAQSAAGPDARAAGEHRPGALRMPLLEQRGGEPQLSLGGEISVSGSQLMPDFGCSFEDQRS